MSKKCFCLSIKNLKKKIDIFNNKFANFVNKILNLFTKFLILFMNNITFIII